MESFESGYFGPEESLEDMRKESAEHLDNLKEKYPTVESIVDDYREGMITEGTLASRFPNDEDQKQVIRIAIERNNKKL